jgi:type IV pilus assembly protein PilV
MKAENLVGPGSNQKGFTLLEVLIAMVILSIGILATTKLQIAFMQGNARARVISETSSEVQGKVEELYNMSYANLNSGTVDQPVEGENCTYTWAVVEDTANQVKTATVTMECPSDKVARPAFTFSRANLYINTGE